MSNRHNSRRTECLSPFVLLSPRRVSRDGGSVTRLPKIKTSISPRIDTYIDIIITNLPLILNMAEPTGLRELIFRFVASHARDRF